MSQTQPACVSTWARQDCEPSWPPQLMTGGSIVHSESIHTRNRAQPRTTRLGTGLNHSGQRPVMAQTSTLSSHLFAHHGPLTCSCLCFTTLAPSQSILAPAFPHLSSFPSNIPCWVSHNPQIPFPNDEWPLYPSPVPLSAITSTRHLEGAFPSSILVVSLKGERLVLTPVWLDQKIMPLAILSHDHEDTSTGPVCV